MDFDGEEYWDGSQRRKRGRSQSLDGGSGSEASESSSLELESDSQRARREFVRSQAPERSQLAAYPQPAHLLAVIRPTDRMRAVTCAAKLFQQMSCQIYQPSRRCFGLALPDTETDKFGVYVRYLLANQLNADLPTRIQTQCMAITNRSKKFDLLVKEPWEDGRYCLYDIVGLSNMALTLPERGRNARSSSNEQQQAGQAYLQVREKFRQAVEVLQGLPEVEHRVIFNVAATNKSRTQVLRGIIDALRKLGLGTNGRNMPKFQLMCRTHEGLIVLTEVYDPNNGDVINRLGRQLSQYYLSTPRNVIPLEQRFQTLLDLVSTWRCVQPTVTGSFVYTRISVVLPLVIELRVEIFNALYAAVGEPDQRVLELGQPVSEEQMLQSFQLSPVKQLAELYNEVQEFVGLLESDLVRLEGWKVKASEFSDKNREINELYRTILDYLRTNNLEDECPLVKNQVIDGDVYRQHFHRSPIRSTVQAYNRAIMERGSLNGQMGQLWTPPQNVQQHGVIQNGI